MNPEEVPMAVLFSSSGMASTGFAFPTNPSLSYPHWLFPPLCAGQEAGRVPPHAEHPTLEGEPAASAGHSGRGFAGVQPHAADAGVLRGRGAQPIGE